MSQNRTEQIIFSYKVEEIIPSPVEYPFPSRQTFINYMEIYSIYPVEDRHSKEEEIYLKDKKEWKLTDSYPSIWEFKYYITGEPFKFTLLIDVEGSECNIHCSFTTEEATSMEFLLHVTAGLKQVVSLVKNCFSDKELFKYLSEEELLSFWNQVDQKLEEERKNQNQQMIETN